ncbi:RNA-binding protein, putative [Plasmodium gallinaceum]|uniref:RNA-binding protein, putative n=1 Tax=Plasmodium gallinaceum TaxID=5849 RepID=A0A1J1GLH2_PLAGA|nr:RNA-binding protein, putative [Plasmodium gallinaceum]CRG93254.1 RNA-binding protein, putative [Plasmodium gallinaceum]
MKEVNETKPHHITKDNTDLLNIGKENVLNDKKMSEPNNLTQNKEENNLIHDKKDCNIEKNDTSNEWIIYVNNNSYGPYNFDQIIELWNENRINLMTPIYKKGENNWKYIYNDNILKNYIYNKNKDENNLINSQNNFNLINESNENNSSEYLNSSSSKNFNINNIKDNNNNKNEILNEKITSNTLDLEKLRKKEKKKKYLERKKKKIEEGLCDRKIKNSSIYITGLPKDVTKEEIHNVFKKAGIIKIDAESTEPKIKIYYDENNNIKGDALITYVYSQSVDIAIKYFDNFYFRQDCIIHVEKAQFNKKKQVAKISKEEILKKKKKIKAAKYEQLRLQKWGEYYTGTKKKIVIFRNVFSYEDAMKYDEGDPFYDFIKNLIEAEIKKYVPVHKVYPIPKHPNGIVCVKFKGVEEAEMIVSCFKDIVLNDKKLEVYFYDGKQDLKVQCLTVEKSGRLNTESTSENKGLDKNIDGNNPILMDQSLKSFHEWIDNQSEDEEHEIMVE